MNLTNSQLKKIISEEITNLLNEANEEKYRLIMGKPFCMAGQCRGDVRVVEVATSKIVVAAKGMGKTPEEALAAGKAQLAKQLVPKGLDINKILLLKK